MEFFSGEMSSSDRDANDGVIFHQAVQAHENQGSYAPPCVEIGGVQVYVYVRDGILVVSGHFDTADTSRQSPFSLYGPDDDAVPVVVDMGDASPVWECLPDDAVTEEDARNIRRAYDDDPGMWPQHVVPAWVGE